jgi:hypothetical protein
VRPAVQAWTSIPIIPEKMEPFTRVKTRELSYRDLNDPLQQPEPGPQRTSGFPSRDLNLGGGRR